MRLFRPHWGAVGTPRQPPTLEPDGIEEQLRAGLQPVEDGRDLACVVLSFKTQRGLAAAVESLLSQDVPVEIVVVNSGGGDPAGVLRSRGIQVEVIDRRSASTPGRREILGSPPPVRHTSRSSLPIAWPSPDGRRAVCDGTEREHSSSPAP